MSDEISGSAPTRASLPDRPHLDWLRKQAKHRLAALHESDPAAKLTDAQRAVAREYGFPSWRALKAHVDSLSIDGQLFDAAREGDVETLGRLLDQHPDRLHARLAPYEWSLLHVAAHKGHLALVDLLLLRGLDPNTREKGDNTYPMHWAAAAGHLDVVRRLAEAGGDVVGDGDDHALQVIGWATCWEGARDAIHAEIADYLVRHGARHHIFSLIALDRADALRELVAAEPAVLNQRMSRNEDHATPLHFAVRMRRPGTVALLIELGADPLAVDASGYPATAYASTPDVDRAMMLRIRAMTSAELLSAERGLRSPRGSTLDLLAALTLHDWDTAERLLRENPSLADARGTHGGALHLASKRGDALAVQWLLDHGASPNGLWPHWDADVTPLHLAALGGHLEVARRLLAAGADPTIRDNKHESDAIGWAAFCGQKEVQQLLEGSLKR